ncbi:MAG: type II toxin-antitoxin system YafQ family toxin [Sulfurimonas sp.]|jgi:mRNA interferase YafQ
MYRKIEITKSFRKDIQKLRFLDEHYTKYIIYISNLLQNISLPPEALDHPLKGEWMSYREFHISGDLLVIYKLTEETLYLVRIGSHSQLFD